jgi:hypothetical protein
MKTRGGTLIPQPFELTEKTVAWIDSKYPDQIDVEETLERFVDWARQEGVVYSDWQAGFKTVIRRGMDNGWRSIVTLRKAKQQMDLAWQNILHEARKFGFREPTQGEGMAIYRSELEHFKRAPKQASVIPLAGVLKRVS